VVIRWIFGSWVDGGVIGGIASGLSAGTYPVLFANTERQRNPALKAPGVCSSPRRRATTSPDSVQASRRPACGAVVIPAHGRLVACGAAGGDAVEYGDNGGEEVGFEGRGDRCWVSRRRRMAPPAMSMTASVSSFRARARWAGLACSARLRRASRMAVLPVARRCVAGVSGSASTSAGRKAASS
jgi:hypothetical protein